MNDTPQPSTAGQAGSTAAGAGAVGPFTLEALVERAAAALGAAGVPRRVALQVAGMLVDAEARGIASHGLTRIESYARRARAGLIDSHAQPALLRESGATALIDGRNAFGVLAADRACNEAARRAQRHGVGWVTAIRSNHVGALGYFVRRLARDGLIGLMWSNAAPAVSAYGGSRPILGTNPLALAAPHDPAPLVLDMATSAVARGRLRRAAAEGRTIPPGWAVDAGGQATSDPAAALAGALLPVGGAKGFGLSVFVEILSGVLGDGASLDEVQDTTKLTGPADIAFGVAALDPFRFTSPPAFRQRLQSLVERLRSSGEAEILMPGETEEAAYRKARDHGVWVAPDVIASLAAETDEESLS